MSAGVNRISTLRKPARMIKRVFISILLAALFGASFSAQAEDEPRDQTSAQNWYKSAFKDLWVSHIERDPEIKDFEEKLIPSKSAKTLYRTWVTNQCVTPGYKPYIAVKSRDGHSPDIVPAFHGSPIADGKPILSPMDAATAQFTVELNHDRLETAYRTFIGEATEEKRLHAKRTLIEMCGEEAVGKLNASLTIQKTGPADESSTDPNWYYTAFRNLWSSHIERDPYLQFIELKLIKDNSARLAYKAWLINMCTTPGDEQSIEGLQAPNTTPLFHKAPIVDGKPIFDQAETANLNYTVKSNRFKLATNLRDYVHTDSKEQRAKAKESLLEMCGAEAVERLDKATAENKAIEQL